MGPEEHRAVIIALWPALGQDLSHTHLRTLYTPPAWDYIHLGPKKL